MNIFQPYHLEKQILQLQDKIPKSSPDQEKFNHFCTALDLRFQMVGDIIHGQKTAMEKLHFTNMSMVRDNYLHTLDPSTSEISNLINPQIISAILSKESYAEQVDIIHQFKLDTNSGYVNGAIFLGLFNRSPNKERNLNFDHTIQLNSKLDGSLIHQSEILYHIKSTDYPKSRDYLKTKIEYLASDLNLSLHHERHTNLVENLNQITIGSSGFESITSAKQTACNQKGVFWYSIGPEIFSAIQILLDASMQCDIDEYRKLHNVCKFFKSESLFFRILSIRCLSNESNGIEYFEYLEEIGKFNNLNHYKKIYQENKKFNRYFDILNKSDNICNYSISAFLKIRNYIAEKRHSKVLDELLNLYEHDESALHFINWDELDDLFPPKKIYNHTKDAFFTLLFMKYSDPDRHEKAYNARGEGYFHRKIQNIVEGTRFINVQPRIRYLVNQVSALPKKSAELFATEILARSTLKLVPFFARSQFVFEDGQKTEVDRFISHIRYQIANLLFDRGIIEKSTLLRCSDEEMAFIKLLYFYEQDIVGRVRISWERYAKYVISQFSEEVNPYFKNFVVGKSGEIPVDFSKLVVETVAEDLTNEVLFLAEYSLDWCISNHIRHGQLRSMLVSAFNGALLATSNEHLDQTGNQCEPEQSGTSTRIPPYFDPKEQKLIAASKKELIELHNRFSECWLDAQNLNHLADDLQSTLFNALEKHVVLGLNDDRQKLEFVDIVKDECSSAMERHLSSIRGELNTDFKEKIHTLIVELCRELNTKHRQRLFDELQSHLYDSIDIACSWLQMTSDDILVNDFEVPVLARYIMNTLFASTISQTKLTCNCLVKSTATNLSASIIVSGKNFNFFIKVLQNIITNAFAHSGLGDATVASINAEFHDSWFVLISRSSISRDEATRLASVYPSLLSQAKSTEIPQLAVEGGSGMARIKRVSQDHFGVLPKINIAPVAQDSKQIVVEYRFDVALANILANQQGDLSDD